MGPIAAITGVGACTSIALTALHTGLLLRAGAVGMMEAALVDANEEPITGCFLPTLDPLLVGAPRVATLAVDALRPALVGLGDLGPSLRLKLVLCLDEALARASPAGAGLGAARAREVLVSVLQAARDLGLELDAEICARGAAGPAFVLPSALGGLGGSHDVLVLLGAHTDYDPATIADLEAHGRLYKEGNLDSLIPGEAAACVLLMTPELARRSGLRSHAKLLSIASGYEKATPYNDESAYEATGLTAAVRQAGAPLVDARLQAGWILSDMTFELRRLYEWQSVSIRARRLFCEPHQIDAPAQRLGHLGAAAMPLHLALAAEAWHHRYAPAPVALSIAGSDGGERAAAVLSGT